jgi:hypothetical protein
MKNGKGNKQDPEHPFLSIHDLLTFRLDSLAYQLAPRNLLGLDAQTPNEQKRDKCPGHVEVGGEHETTENPSYCPN